LYRSVGVEGLMRPQHPLMRPQHPLGEGVAPLLCFRVLAFETLGQNGPRSVGERVNYVSQLQAGPIHNNSMTIFFLLLKKNLVRRDKYLSDEGFF
jgi:hypothetical protein